MVTLTPFIKSFMVDFTPVADLDLLGYKTHAVHVSELVNGDFTPSASNMVNHGPDTNFAVTHINEVPLQGGEYFVKIAAYDAFGEDVLNYSQIYSVVVATADPLDQVAPDPPVWGACSTGIDSSEAVDNIYISLSWALEEPEDFSNYILAHKKATDTSWTEIITTVKTHRFNNLIAGTTYQFQIKAVDRWNNASTFVAYNAGNGLLAAKDTVAPSAPSGLSAVAAFKNVFVKWTANSESDFKEYILKVDDNSGFTSPEEFRCQTNSFTYQTTAGVTSYFKVASIDYSGNVSDYSAYTSATTALVVAVDIASSTITATQIANGSIDLGGTKITGLLANTNLGQITDATKIADSLIGNAKLAALAVDATKLADSAVTSTKIANAAVGTAAIANAAITNALIANLAVGSAQIADAAITNAKIGLLAVGSAQIADAAITNAKIGLLAVNTANINDAAITNAKIGNLAVDAAKIADLTVTGAKIANATIGTAKITDLVADKITTGTLSAATTISVGDTSLKLDGVNKRVTVNDGTRDRVYVGKLATGDYGVDIKDAAGLSVVKVSNSAGAVVQNATVGNLYVAGTGGILCGTDNGTSHFKVWESVAGNMSMHLGNTAGQHISWNGSVLDINAKVTLSADSTIQWDQVVDANGDPVVLAPTNKVTRSTTPPTVDVQSGDTWFNTSVTDGTYYAQTGYIWNGTVWSQVSARGTYISSTGIYTGNLTANNYVLGNGSTYGSIKSYGWDDATTTKGIKIQDDSMAPIIDIRGGIIQGTVITGGTVQSPAFISGAATGFRLLESGEAEFNKVKVRGTISATSVQVPITSVAYCSGAAGYLTRVATVPLTLDTVQSSGGVHCACFQLTGSYELYPVYPTAMAMQADIIDANNNMLWHGQVTMENHAWVLGVSTILSTEKQEYDLGYPYQQITFGVYPFNVYLMVQLDTTYTTTWAANGTYTCALPSVPVVLPLRAVFSTYNIGGTGTTQNFVCSSQQVIL